MSDFRKYTVSVEGNELGSGCIINALSEEYDYLITAKHLVNNTDVSDIKVTSLVLDNDKIAKSSITLMENRFYTHESDEIDAAIFKIDKGNVSHELQISECYNGGLFKLCGFPDTRKDEEDPYKVFDIKTLFNKVHGYCEAQVQGNIAPIRQEIVGFSGGGIFEKNENGTNLIAIQSRMSVNDDIETHGRIDIIPMSKYREIISKEKLAPILPDYLKCFSVYKNDIFGLEDCWNPDEIKNTKSILQGLSKKIIDFGIYPYLLEEKYNTRLLVKGQSEVVLTNRQLWESWLEFLIINYIYTKHSVEIDEIFNNRRLLFSNVNEPWSKIIKNILESDYIGLAKNGCIIISNPVKPTDTVLTGQIITNIAKSNEIDDERFMIDEGIEHPLKDYKIIHLHAFSQECILSKSHEYADFTTLNKNELLKKLEEEYGKIFEK